MQTGSSGWLEETLAVFARTGTRGEPLTTREVTEQLDCTRRATYDRLQRLADRGTLHTKKVGARGRIWWRVPTDASTSGSEAESETTTTVVDSATAENARLHEQQFESLVDAVSEYALFMLDAEGRVTSWNQGAEQIKGYEADEIIGRPVSVFYPAEERAADAPARNLAAAARDGSIEKEGWRVRKDGSQFKARVTLTALTDDEGTVTGYVKVTRDMTRQHQYEERLARQRDELERELDEVFERIDDGFFAVDDAFRITYVNERAANLFETNEKTLLGETVWDVLTVLDEHELREHFQQALGSQQPVECERYVDSLNSWIAVTTYPSDTGLSVYVRDVTTHREREHELEQYEAAVETIGDGVYIVDDESRFLLVNDTFAELTGYDRDELLGAHASLVTTDDDLAQAERHGDQFNQVGKGVTTIEAELVTKDGRQFPVETRFALFQTEADQGGRVGVTRDITERKQREREREARIRQQEAVTELGKMAIECHDIDRLMRRAATLVAETLDADYCKVLDLDVERAELLLRQGIGWDDGIVGEATVSAVDDDSQAAHTLRTDQPIVVEDLDTERRFSGPALLTDHDVTSGISTIISASGTPWGILGTHDTARRTFTDHDVNFVQSVAHILSAAIDRHEYERELEQYETIVETIDDGVYVLDDGYHFTSVNQAYLEMMGYDREEVLGAHCSLVVGEDVSALAADRSKALVDTGDHATLEAEIERADGTHFFAESRFTPLPADDADDGFTGTVGVVRDTTERRQREHELERQREQLAALNDLRRVISGITEAVITQSTREAIERIVCDRLADADTYQFALVGELDRSSNAIDIKAAAGCEDIGDIELSNDGGTPSDYGELIEQAIQTKTVQRRRYRDSDDGEASPSAGSDATVEQAREAHHGSTVQSTVAIPIVHDEMVFGVVVIGTDRRNAFEGDERPTIDHLGDIVGHAIASIERKRALMSDEVIELQYRTQDLSSTLGHPSQMSGTISIERTIATGDERYLSYGTCTDDAVEALETILDANPNWEELTVKSCAGGECDFEVVVSEPPVASVVTAQGGEVVEARIVDGTAELQFHLPPGADVRAISDVVEQEYPGVELVTRRQVSRVRTGNQSALLDGLTDRQRAALDASYQAGFFEWPRSSSGEDVAKSLDISPSTFHQHLRIAERKVFESLLSSATHD